MIKAYMHGHRRLPDSPSPPWRHPHSERTRPERDTLYDDVAVLPDNTFFCYIHSMDPTSPTRLMEGTLTFLMGKENNVL